MDNAVPSLHIGFPNFLTYPKSPHCRELGIEIKDWRHREFDIFVMANVESTSSQFNTSEFTG
ncbi:MAG: hypothetical protein Ct9H90mP14_2090 [Methanobacteriota archaeon]|nr:MAG: hypothetical protein Ct9H90mP14_2090 [Euryarchaeota archaeon]